MLLPIVQTINSYLSDYVLVILLLLIGLWYSFRTRFVQVRCFGEGIRSVFGNLSLNGKKHKKGMSSFQALTTAIAAQVGTGNIVGVATAMVSGGPGALVWMEVSAFFGLTTKYAECLLAFKYREKNAKGEMAGGPMYTMKNGIANKSLGRVMGLLFALFGALASFGIGNLSQANSISGAVKTAFHVPTWVTGLVLTALTLLIVVGGIKSISRVSSVVVPVMAVFYVIAGLLSIILNFRNVPTGLYQILVMSVNPKAVGGGVLGAITATVMNSMRYGVARGVFSNEAGLGSAAIAASASATEDPVEQGYISMTGVFFDTIIVCTITGLAIASSGILGSLGPDGKVLKGVDLTMQAFASSLGPAGIYLVSIGVILFAFSTILGWEYQGEKSFEYILPDPKCVLVYRIVFSLAVFFGATQALDLVWNISDIMNALMAIPNLICLLLLSKEIASETKRYQKILEAKKMQS